MNVYVGICHLPIIPIGHKITDVNLFSILGPRFFSILTSSNRELYAEALFVLLESFSPEEPTLKRDSYSRKLADRFASILQDADFSDDEEFVDEPSTDKVSFIIRKLKETGWIEIAQIENTFSEEIIVPDYSVAIIRVLKNISERKEIELRGRVYSSYSMLRSAESDEEKYLALKGSYDNMAQFSSELVTIFTNIRGEYQKCLKIEDLSDLLSSFLEKYQDNIVRRFIEPLSTINSAVRYRADIIRILAEWMNDSGTREAIAKETAKAEGINEEEAELETFSRIDKIITGYDSQIALINSIFERDRKYTQLSTERIRYKTRSGMDTKGLLSRLMEKLNDENALPVLEDAIESTGLDAADSRSLYERSAPERLADGEREIVERRVIPEGIGKAFLEAIEAQVSSEEIDRYVLSAIGNRKEITTEDFPVGTIEEFVLFILATVRNGEKDAPYIMDESSGKDVTMPKGTVLPFVRARRKHGIQR